MGSTMSNVTKVGPQVRNQVICFYPTHYTVAKIREDEGDGFG